MENVEKAMRMFPNDAKLSTITEASSKYFSNGSGKEGEGIAAALSSSDQSRILISRPSRWMTRMVPEGKCAYGKGCSGAEYFYSLCMYGQCVMEEGQAWIPTTPS